MVERFEWVTVPAEGGDWLAVWAGFASHEAAVLLFRELDPLSNTEVIGAAVEEAVAVLELHADLAGISKGQGVRTHFKVGDGCVAITAIEDEGVGPAAAVENIDSGAAINQVVTIASINGVVASIAAESVMAFVAIDGVVAVTTGDAVITATGVDQ